MVTIEEIRAYNGTLIAFFDRCCDGAPYIYVPVDCMVNKRVLPFIRSIYPDIFVMRTGREFVCFSVIDKILRDFREESTIMRRQVASAKLSATEREKRSLTIKMTLSK